MGFVRCNDKKGDHRSPFLLFNGRLTTSLMATVREITFFRLPLRPFLLFLCDLCVNASAL